MSAKIRKLPKNRCKLCIWIATIAALQGIGFSQGKGDTAKFRNSEVTFRPFETSKLTGNELVDILRERFASLPIEIPASYDEKLDPGLKVYEGSFILDSSLKFNPKVEVIYRIPLRPNKSAGPDADNIVMEGFWYKINQPRKVSVKDGKEIKDASPLHQPLSYFADSLGYTAFSMHFLTTAESLKDPQEAYYVGGSEWVNLVFRAKEEIARLHHLKSRKLLLYGRSLGGTFVEHIAAARPEKVAAVAIECAPDLVPPKIQTDTAWLLAITRGDSMRSDYQKLGQDLTGLKATFIFNIFPPNFGFRGTRNDPNFYHNSNPLTKAACRSFLKGVVDRQGTLEKSDSNKWPLVRDRLKPLRILNARSREGLAIAPERREYLPSKAFAQILQSLPAQVQSVDIPIPNGRQVSCLVGIPPLGKPKGILIYCQKVQYSNLAKLFDNIYYFSQMGYLVFAPKLDFEPDEVIQSTVAIIKSTSLLAGLPLAAVGYGEKNRDLWKSISLDPRFSPRVAAFMEFSPGNSLDEAQLPVDAGVKCPILFTYDAKPIVSNSRMEDVRESLDMVKTVRAFVTKCQQRNQLARILVIQADSHSDAQATQRSVAGVADFLTKVIENRKSEISIPK